MAYNKGFDAISYMIRIINIQVFSFESPENNK